MVSGLFYEQNVPDLFLTGTSNVIDVRNIFSYKQMIGATGPAISPAPLMSNSSIQTLILIRQQVSVTCHPFIFETIRFRNFFG